MSYINDALRKVQKERDNRYTPYDDIISSDSYNASRIRRRRGLSLPLASVVLLSLLLIMSTYFIYKYKREMKSSKALTPTIVAGVPQQNETKSKTDAPVAPQKGVVSEPAVQGTVKEEREKTGKLLREIKKPNNSALIASLYEEGLTAHRQRNWGQAEYFYQKILTLEPHHLSALNNLGVVFLSTKRYDEAEELFGKAIASKRDYVDPYYNLACLNVQKGNIKAGMDFLKKAVQLDSRVKEWASSDPDLAGLRSLPEFVKLMAP